MKTVAIVGRPNVGKSRLFNRLIGRRYAIVEGTPGITRDRIEKVGEWRGRRIRWIDTGGIGSDDDLSSLVAFQVRVAIEAADLIIFVVDGAEGLLPLDEEIADSLRGRKPVILAVNKIDHPKRESLVSEFFSLGFEESFAVSAEHGRGVGDLLDSVVERLGSEEEGESDEEGGVRVSIVGRPNVGKSSLLNAFLETERVIVSEIPGTTRDTVEETIDLPQGRITFVDTAGIRRKRRKYDLLESIMVSRTRNAVSASDAAIVVADAVEGITEQDVKIVQAVFALGRCAVLALNKWDAVSEKDFDAVLKGFRAKYPTDAHLPVISVSALRRLRLRRLLSTVLDTVERSRFRFRTSELNRLLGPVAAQAPRKVKLRYALQKSISPPTFVLFGSGRPPHSYLHFIRNTIRDAGGFQGIPLNIEFRS
ncbi:MAG: ribosome biogenesis GTPase Der [Candidatus Hydrogenedentota bacterium]|nr:MAG: ribosome biogenesis GTPase Der [Candidatus Hydrogenedentota bacterium]